jgi:FAD/FMN-containing dehydrogenase
MSGEEQPASSAPIGEAALKEFGAALRGTLIRPGDDAYEEARKVWNGMIDKRPALIVRCAGVADVMSAVQFARGNNLLVAVRGGGHNVAGNAVCDGGMVIDLSLLKSIRVDPAAQTARAEPGLTWGEFDRETQAFGLATTGGLVSTTGISGFTLGGGIGWLVREYGPTCDNLLSADVVTADGRLVTASPHENADLFWGIRGGGGNFGVVTSFEYRLHPVGPMVLGGLVLHPVAKAKELLRFYRDFAAKAPEELTTLVVFITAPPAPFIPETLQGAPMVGVALCYSGRMEDGAQVVQPLKEFGPPSVDLVGPIPYRVLQSMFDAGAPSGLLNYWKSEYLEDLSDEAIEVLAERVMGISSPLTQVHVHHLGGALSRVAEDETAFGHRKLPFILNIISLWTDPAQSTSQTRWTREFHNAMRRFSGGGVYVNFLGEEGEDRVRAAYGDAKYRRLAALKDKYDPTNFFRRNQNIRPSGEATKKKAA